MLFGAVLTELQLTWGTKTQGREQRHGEGNPEIWWGTTSFSILGAKHSESLN